MSNNDVLIKIMKDVSNLKHSVNRIENATKGSPKVGGTLSQRWGSWYERSLLSVQPWCCLLYTSPSPRD